ncbi:PBP1A family penicillin-binding protein [Alteromonas sp. ASW11-36]|uniref:Penicillin-binding protein 1A n=1 Tax=Alteromonas arenosi TaxID=3055817 RepID=A0ABT7T040_9ALTE|nr:PBP1A family penicillin-binding protein [Alteromonas sp. ASW11-36]MDM7861619.1 PBP1A family penicillin-binding protein [Alteromonas sp. ASW11-36]
MKYIKPLFITFVISTLIGIAALTGIYFYIKPDLPSVDVLKEVKLQTPMRIYTHDGKLISQYGVKRRIPLRLDQVPVKLQEALLATEDSRFYDHVGIDPIGVMRAAINLLVTGEKSQGASTLTMQLARNFFLTREKTYIRKIKEIFIALHMEQVLTKDEILELYLNKVELGHRSFGVGAAAQVYYGKSVDQLTLAEIATIAGLPQAPSVLNPISRPDRSVERRRIVLLRMLDEGFITREEFDEANNAPVTARKHGAEIELDAPYLADVIYNEMIEIYGKEEAETGGYQVYATAPYATQLAAQEAVVRNIHDYDERHGYRGPERYLWELHEQEPEEAEQAGLEQALETEEFVDTPASERIDINALPLPLEDIKAQLLAINPIDPLLPALVIDVHADSMTVLTSFDQQNLTTIELDWDNISWARPYISDSQQGPDPETAGDIVASGALVWIRQQEGAWRLSQVPDVSSAFIAIDPFNGAVQAVVGGYNFYQSQFNRATQAKRQVGSNIKPFVYSAALDSGYTLASIINDAPINQWDASTGVAWRPQNSPAEYDGPVRMRYALGRSKNVVSVRLLRGVGLDDTVEYLTRFGFEREEIPRDETVSLGSGSHTPLEVVRGFASFANGGFLVQPHFISHITNDAGEVLWRANPAVACDPCEQPTKPSELGGVDGEVDLETLLAQEFEQINQPAEDESQLPMISAERVISEHTAFLTKEMLRTAVRTNGSWTYNTYWQGTGWRARNILQRTDIGGKTGTTNDSRDTWFSGYAPGIVATSWVGFDDMSRQLGRASRNQNLINLNPQRFNWIGNALIGSEDGAKAAQPAWIRFMQQVLEGVEEQPTMTPEGLLRVRIDRSSGLLTQRTDHTTMFEFFVPGTEPVQYVLEEEIVDPADEQVKPNEPDEIF